MLSLKIPYNSLNGFLFNVQHDSILMAVQASNVRKYLPFLQPMSAVSEKLDNDSYD